MIKLNFSHPNSILEAEGYVNHQLHVDLSDAELLNKLKIYLAPIVGDGKELVTIVLPGLSLLAVFVVVAIHGLIGNFPFIVSMVRKEDGFEPLPPVNLQEYRNSCIRKSREGLTVL